MELRTEIEIDASPAAVWRVLTDTSRFHEWNPFITKLTGELREGQRLNVTISPPEGSDMEFHPEVLVLRPEQELRWRGKMLAGFVFSGEHFFVLKATDEGRTRFSHGEDFSGFLVRFLKRQLTDTARGFVYMNRALKRRVEEQA